MRHSDPKAGLGTLFSTLTAMVSPRHAALTAKPLRENLPALGLRPYITGMLHYTSRTLALWNERSNQRHRMLKLDDHQLRDLGLTRAQVEIEWQKPFWLP